MSEPQIAAECSNKRPWVLIASGFHNKGGQDRANLALADFLLEKKIPLYLVCHSLEPHLAGHPLVKTYRVPRPGNSTLLGGFLMTFWGHFVASKVVRNEPKAYVLTNGGNCLWKGINWAHYVHHAWRAHKDGAPLFYRITGFLSDAWGRISERMAFQRSRLIVSNSQRTTREVIEFFGVEKNRVHTVYLGSDPNWGPVSGQERAESREALGLGDRPAAIFVGGIGYDDRKGFDLLVRAWANLDSRPDWDVDLLVAGGGAASALWQTRVSQMGLSKRIRFLGFSDRIDRVLAAVDLLVSPVRYEAYGLNVQEAICRGIPAMVSASAGVAERYDADFAPMVIPKPDDVEQLVQSLLAWRSNKDYWAVRFQSFGDSLRRRSWRDTAVELVEIVEHSGL